MTTSERIRAAALGRLPRRSEHLSSWDVQWHVVVKFVPQRGRPGGYMQDLTPIERRMFLLFVSEAVK